MTTRFSIIDKIAAAIVEISNLGPFVSSAGEPIDPLSEWVFSPIAVGQASRENQRWSARQRLLFDQIDGGSWVSGPGWDVDRQTLV